MNSNELPHKLDTKLLKERKGVLSRLIGEAKKAGEPLDALLAEMREVSALLKEASAAKSKKTASDPKPEPKPHSKVVKPPAMFAKRCNVALSGKIEIFEADRSHAQEWDAFVATTPGASLYHRWAFKPLIEEVFGHRVPYIAARDQSQNIVGVLPMVELSSPMFGHFLVSMPYFNYGGVLVIHDEAEQALITHARQYLAQGTAEHLELRHTHTLQGLPEKTQKVSMIRELPPTSNQLFDEVGSKVRAQIRKSDRQGLAIRFGGHELLDDFYRVFARNMRDLGTPVYSKRFFSALLQCELKEFFTLGVVYSENKAVSCCFLCQQENVMEIPWASTLREANSLNANMFMYWQVLQRAINEGCDYFDFGRSSIDAGTYKFKKQWGAKPYQLYWHYVLKEGGALPELNPNNPKFQLLIAIWQRFPVWLTRLIGPPVVKYLP